MDENFLKEVSAQLRKPSGEFGNEVAQRMNESNREMNLTTIHSLNIKDGHSVLEIGMGNGFFVNDILTKGANVTYIGCDYSKDMVDFSTKINQEFIDSGKATFHQTEAHHLPVDNHSIDILFTINTLYFWDDKPAILSEFKRVLKYEGTLAIAIRPEGCMREYPSTQYNFDYYTQEQVRELLTGHGFKVFELIEKKELEMEVLGKMVTPEFAVILASLSSLS